MPCDGTYNAKIERAEVVIEDHGILTTEIILAYAGCGQGFPAPRIEKNGDFLRRIMDCCDVRQWSQVSGRYVRVKVLDGLIVAMGHITEERWFVPYEEDPAP